MPTAATPVPSRARDRSVRRARDGIERQAARGNHCMTDRAVFHGRAIDPVAQPAAVRHLRGEHPVRHRRRRFVERMPFRGKAHHSVAERQRDAAGKSRLGLHRRGCALPEHGQDVAHVVRDLILVYWNALAPGERRRFSGQRIVMTREAAASGEDALRALEQQRHAPLDRQARVADASPLRTGTGWRRGPSPRVAPDFSSTSIFARSPL